jgi:hypothetical protein
VAVDDREQDLVRERVKERDHYPALISGARRDGILLVRIVDAPYTGKKPFDMFGIRKGRGIAVEVKKSRFSCLNPTGRPVGLESLAKLEPHQKTWLSVWAREDGISLVFVLSADSASCGIWQVTGDGYRRLKDLVKMDECWVGWPSDDLLEFQSDSRPRLSGG